MHHAHSSIFRTVNLLNFLFVVQHVTSVPKVGVGTDVSRYLRKFNFPFSVYACFSVPKRHATYGKLTVLLWDLVGMVDEKSLNNMVDYTNEASLT